jgi:2-phospho-L-lactate guanylyltransferase
MKCTYAIIPVSRFSHAKTRLSPTLTPSEREGLLKAMLTDVTSALKNHVDRVVVISSDEDVLEFAYGLGVTILQEKGQTDLNGALKQAVEWCSGECSKVIITPSDIPLLGLANPKKIIEDSEKYDVVIAPAKGGGTNAIVFQPEAIELKFGECSFFEHLLEAKNNGLTSKIYDSFYLSLDVNTAEDLGEIMLHGPNTNTQEYLKKLNLTVKPFHGAERLEVKRKFL